jgi:hypothetical protein
VKVETLRLPAIACALAIPLCALAIRPFVEMGVNDDWSYIKTVQILAQTGHIVYNGWATAMLGWQLYLGAFFVKLFGFSFTAVRASMLLVAMATAFLTQRTIVRAGISDWNATLGTLVLVTSPLFLPSAFIFMTDVTGLFCIVLCLYACLRSLQAETDRAAFAWIVFAAVSNTIGGTARQVAWLGVLVMVPSTLWLLRRRPRFLLAGSLLYLISVAFIFVFVHWFHQQPYSVPENPVHGRVTLGAVSFLATNMFRASLDTSLFLLPILLLFLLALRHGDRRSIKFFAIGISLPILFCLVNFRHIVYWLAPYLGNYVTIYGFVADDAIHGTRIVLNLGVRILVTILDIAAVFALIALVLADANKPRSSPSPEPQISWYRLSMLIMPFTVAYIILLIPRAAFGKLFFDRYLIPVMMMVLILIMRFYQEQVQPRVSAWTLLPIAIFAAFGIAGTHDMFAIHRGRLAAVEELRSAGVPPTAIDAGFEYNGWTQIERARYINDPRIPLMPGDHFSPLKVPYKLCRPLFIENFSALSPRYSMAYDPAECEGPTQFAPVTVRTWLGPRYTTLYIVNVGNSKTD